MARKKKTVPAEVPAVDAVQLTDDMKGFLRSYRNGIDSYDPVPIAEANLRAAGLAGIKLVRDDARNPGDAFGFPTDEATKILADKITGVPVFHAGLHSGTGPATAYQWNSIMLTYGDKSFVISASTALKEIAQLGLGRYKWELYSVFGGSRDGLL